MASSDSQINKPQRGCPKRAKLLDANINTGVQSIKYILRALMLRVSFKLFSFDPDTMHSTSKGVKSKIGIKTKNGIVFICDT